MHGAVTAHVEPRTLEGHAVRLPGELGLKRVIEDLMPKLGLAAIFDCTKSTPGSVVYKAPWLILRVILIGATLFCTTQVQARSCGDVLAAIRDVSKYCGFFCDQDEVRPLQVEYESNCIAEIPRLILQVGSRPDVTIRPAKTLVQSRSQAIGSFRSDNDQSILDRGKAVDASSIMLSSARRSAAHLSLHYCNRVLVGMPSGSAKMGLTEDTADPVGALSEFSLWQLTKIFSGCAEHAMETLNAQDDRQEISAWIKLTGLIDEERKVKRLAAVANVTHLLQGTAENKLYEADNWAIMRSSMLEVMAQSFNNP